MARHPRSGARAPLVVIGPIIAAAAVAMAVSVTFGLYSSKPAAENNSFTSGDLTLTNVVTGACTVTLMAPGDSPTACTLALTYSGNLSAYLAVDTLIETQAGNGGTDLYNPGGSNGLSVSIVDNQTTSVTYTVPTTSTTCPGGAPTGSTCYELDNELLGTAAYTNGSTDTISTSVTLPAAAANIYQAGGAQVILSAHAVQSKNNTMACTATPTKGAPCTPSGTFAWS